MAYQIASVCIASHHSGMIDCLSSIGDIDLFERRMRKDVNLNHVIRQMEREVLNQANPFDWKMLSGLMRIIFEIYQLESKSKVDLESKLKDGKTRRVYFACGIVARMLFSCLIDADRTNTSDFEYFGNKYCRNYGKFPKWDILTQRFEKYISGLEEKSPIDKIRQDISDQCLNASHREKGIFTLTVPTGGGKTLSSMRFALNHANKHGHSRIIYVVPFTTIIDQNADVIRSILEKGKFSSVVLEHHCNLVEEKYTSTMRTLAENWDVPIVYTTMVRFLESLFSSGTREVRRTHCLANSIIVFDEIQSIPVKTVHMFCNAVNTFLNHFGCTVVMCTATQPILERVEPAKGRLNITKECEIVQNVNSVFDSLKRVEIINKVRKEKWTSSDIAVQACENVSNYENCLVITNTKKAALEIYEECKALANCQVFHLSTNMCPNHRMDILERVYLHIGKNGLPPKDKQPIICVSTQLIEAGIDIDFGSIIRQTAGIDSIAQAAGRCNRNGRMKSGVVMLVNSEDKGLSYLPDIMAGKNITECLLEEIYHSDPLDQTKSFLFGPSVVGLDITHPSVIEKYFEHYFYQRSGEMSYPVSTEKHHRNDDLLDMLAHNPKAMGEHKRIHGKIPQSSKLLQSFKSANDMFRVFPENTFHIVVPYDNAPDVIEKIRSQEDPSGIKGSLMQQAQRYSVSVFDNELKKLKDVGAIEEQHGMMFLDKKFYNDEYGLDKRGI